uniref:Uncharacterized protein n=1 Tax=viral metagenome TaxID=1070528 RepID=A0A6M3LIQ6_9ZZZZ
MAESGSTETVREMAQDGADITAAVMPSGGWGIRGWLSAIYTHFTAGLTASAPAAVSVGVASTVILVANANRKGCLLVNTSAGYISLAFGAAAVLYSGITLGPLDGTFKMDKHSLILGEIRGIASQAACNIGVQELT